MGRWVNRDPIGYLGGINLYEYVSSDPIIQLDWSGFAKTELTHWHAWDNMYSILENALRKWLGIDGTVAVGQHHVRVWATSSDGCTIDAQGIDTSRSFDDPLTDMEISNSRPFFSEFGPKDCCEKVECVSYTSNYTVFFGINFKGFELGWTIATSTITIRVCADGTKKLEDHRQWPGHG